MSEENEKPKYRVRINAWESKRGLTTYDCTIEYQCSDLPSTSDTIAMNFLMQQTIKNAKERFGTRRHSFFTKQ